MQLGHSHPIDSRMELVLKQAHSVWNNGYLLKPTQEQVPSVIARVMKRRSTSGLRRTETQDIYQSVVAIKPFNVNHKFAEYNQHDATFHNLFFSVRRSTRFRRVFRPSSELKTAPTASGVCQACCWPGQASSR